MFSVSSSARRVPWLLGLAALHTALETAEIPYELHESAWQFAFGDTEDADSSILSPYGITDTTDPVRIRLQLMKEQPQRALIVASLCSQIKVPNLPTLVNQEPGQSRSPGLTVDIEAYSDALSAALESLRTEFRDITEFTEQAAIETLEEADQEITLFERLDALVSQYKGTQNRLAEKQNAVEQLQRQISSSEVEAEGIRTQLDALLQTAAEFDLEMSQHGYSLSEYKKQLERKNSAATRLAQSAELRDRLSCETASLTDYRSTLDEKMQQLKDLMKAVDFHPDKLKQMASAMRQLASEHGIQTDIPDLVISPSAVDNLSVQEIVDSLQVRYRELTKYSESLSVSLSSIHECLLEEYTQTQHQIDSEQQSVAVLQDPLPQTETDVEQVYRERALQYDIILGDRRAALDATRRDVDGYKQKLEAELEQYTERAKQRSEEYRQLEEKLAKKSSAIAELSQIVNEVYEDISESIQRHKLAMERFDRFSSAVEDALNSPAEESWTALLSPLPDPD